MLITCMFNLVICDGIPFYMSVLYVEYLDEFQRSKAETTLVQSVCTGVFFCAGIKVNKHAVYEYNFILLKRSLESLTI